MNYINRKLVAGSTCIIAVCLHLFAAPTISKGQLTHRDLEFQGVDLITTLLDTPGTSKVKVTREIRPPGGVYYPAGEAKYVFKVERNVPFDGIYSLFTLGIQAVDWNAEVSSVYPANNGSTIIVGFYKNENAQMTDFKAGTKIIHPSKTWNSADNRFVINADEVSFIRLKGASTFTITLVTKSRKKNGKTIWEGGESGNSHDNTPPD